MHVDSMRKVDRRLGRPLAFLLTLWRKLRGDPPAPSPAAVRRVLFIKLSEMGAVVLAAPAFAEARRSFPSAEVWLLCFEENSDVAELAAGVPPERQIRVATPTLGDALRSFLAAVRRIRSLDFDVVIDLEYFSRVSALLSYLSGAPRRAGFHRFEAEGLYCGDLYTHRVTFNPYLHIARSMVALSMAAAADAAEVPHLKEVLPELEELTFPSHRPTDEETATVRALLEREGVPADAPLLVVNPNSSDLLPLRRWPAERFVEVCELLMKRRPDAWVVLTGTGNERPLGDRILMELRRRDPRARCVSLIGRTDLRELLALLDLSLILVSADSGPPHFAALTRTLGVTIFGPETPRLYGPVTPRNKALTLELACSPCISAWNQRVSPCHDNQCMQRISAFWVADEAMSMLDRAELGEFDEVG